MTSHIHLLSGLEILLKVKVAFSLSVPKSKKCERVDIPAEADAPATSVSQSVLLEDTYKDSCVDGRHVSFMPPLH